MLASWAPGENSTRMFEALMWITPLSFASQIFATPTIRQDLSMTKSSWLTTTSGSLSWERSGRQTAAAIEKSRLKRSVSPTNNPARGPQAFAKREVGVGAVHADRSKQAVREPTITA